MLHSATRGLATPLSAIRRSAPRGSAMPASGDDSDSDDESDSDHDSGIALN
jgi:hypothetical protein